MPNQPSNLNQQQKPQINVKYVLIVAILAFLVGGGILGYQYWWLPRQEAKPSEITTTDETADWQTYRNQEYGYEFRYPESLFNSVNTKENKYENQENKWFETSLFRAEGDRGYMWIGIINEKLTPDSTINTGYGMSRIKDLDIVKISDKDAYTYTISDAGCTERSILYMLSNDVLEICFGFCFAADTPENIKRLTDDNNLINQIISTFEFTK